MNTTQGVLKLCSRCEAPQSGDSSYCNKCGASLLDPVSLSAQQAPINITNSFNTQASPVVVIHHKSSGPNALVRIIWFLFVGLWLGLLCTVVGWLLCVAVITLPIGLLMLNRLPAIMTLRPATSTLQVTVAGNVTTVNTSVCARQHSFIVRAVFFLVVGWWASAIWLVAAWCLVAFSVPTLGLTLAPAFLMFDRVPVVLTLRVN
jgi:uncharacterized membrane protein YccF (DUF307 family)